MLIKIKTLQVDFFCVFTEEYISKNFLPKASNPHQKFKESARTKAGYLLYLHFSLHIKRQKKIQNSKELFNTSSFRISSHLFLLNKKPKSTYLFKTNNTGKGVMNRIHRED